MHTVGPGKMATKLKKVKNETDTLYDLEYGEKQCKARKMRNTHSRNGIWREN